MGILKWHHGWVPYSTCYLHISVDLESIHRNHFIAKPLQDLWVLNEFRLAGLRQPQVRETDGGTTHTGLQGIILCGIGLNHVFPGIGLLTVYPITHWYLLFRHYAHDPISRIKSAMQIYTWINRAKIIVRLYWSLPGLQHIKSLRPSDAYVRQQTNHHWFR